MRDGADGGDRRGPRVDVVLAAPTTMTHVSTRPANSSASGKSTTGGVSTTTQSNWSRISARNRPRRSETSNAPDRHRDCPPVITESVGDSVGRAGAHQAV